MIKLIRRLFCKHDWRVKGCGTYHGLAVASEAYRCCKCGKQKHTSYLYGKRL